MPRPLSHFHGPDRGISGAGAASADLAERRDLLLDDGVLLRLRWEQLGGETPRRELRLHVTRLRRRLGVVTMLLQRLGMHETVAPGHARMPGATAVPDVAAWGCDRSSVD